MENSAEKNEINLFEVFSSYIHKAHATAKNRYGSHTYSYHLKAVDKIIKQFIYYIPISKRDIVRCGGIGHDVIEEARQSYNDVKKVSNKEIAELVFVLTDLRGRTREERHSGEYYKCIKETPYATFIKLADRISNIEESINTNSRFLKKYKTEHKEFKNSLYKKGEYDKMWEYLEDLFKTKLYLDDKRKTPRGFWDRVKSFEEFISYIKEKGVPDIISFDHDLGHIEKTGLTCVKWLIENDHQINEFRVHSSNAPGRVNMLSWLSNYKKHTQSEI
jgi:(p)ppGpp synthase/HD superfamily hydrolase